MASYGIGEVEALLGLPASTLRYWEKTLTLLDPRKDEFGRRVYSESDLRILFRLKHLAFDKGLGIKAAGEAFLAEAALPVGEFRARVFEIRGDLIDLYFTNRGRARRPLRDAKTKNTRR